MPPPLVAGPFTHMVYNADVFRNEPGSVYYAQQMVPADPVDGGPYVRRASDWAGITAPNITVLQFLGVLRRRSGFLNVMIADGQIWSATIAGGPWSLVVTTANFATATITISTAATIHAVTFNNQLVVNDGVNRPFTWDGSAGAGGLVSLTNAPAVCFGKPAVYYGKIFWIKDVAAASADRSTLVWSEENAPNTGYEAGGYNNAWTLEQSGAGPLVAILGTNEALYYWRPTAIGRIGGAVTPDFRTAGTHDDVSRTVGTTSPGGVALGEAEIWFPDAKGWPWMLPIGGVPESRVSDIADFFTLMDQTATVTFSAADIAKIQVVPIPFDRAVLFSYQKNNNGYSFDFFAFSTATRRAISFWNFSVNITRIGEAWDEESSIAGLWAGGVGAPGKTLLHPPRGTTSRYATSSTDQGIFLPAVMLRPLGAEVGGTEWNFVECAVEFDVGGDAGLPGAGGVQLMVNSDEYLLSGSGGVNATVGTVSLQNFADRQNQRRVFGLQRTLRFIAPRFEQTSYSLRGWGVGRVRVTAIPRPAAALRT